MWLLWFTSASGWVGPFQCQTAADVFTNINQHGGQDPYQKWHWDPNQGWIFDGPTVESSLAFPLVLEQVIYIAGSNGVAFFIQKQ